MSIGDYDYDDLMKDHLKDFFAELGEKAHSIYAVLADLPKANFYIRRYYDMKKNVDTFDDKRNKFSFREFHDLLDTFHPEDPLGISFHVHLKTVETSKADDYCETVTLSHKKETTVEAMKEAFGIFLESYCEKCYRDNQPFRLTPAVIARLALTPADVQELSALLNRYNAKARRKIRAEYNALCGLDFIRKGRE